MDGLALIEQAKDAGLELALVNGELKLKGARRLKPLVELITQSKEEVIAALASLDQPPAVSADSCDLQDSISADVDTRSEISRDTGRVSAEHDPKKTLASLEEVDLWINLLREQGASIRLCDGLPKVDWPTHLKSKGRERDWQNHLTPITAVLEAEEAQRHAAVKATAPKGFSPRRTEVPGPEICADPVQACPRCSKGRVLKELREMTGGTCWTCWERDHRSRS